MQGDEGLAERTAKKLKSNELLITEMGGVYLRRFLDQIPLWRGDHVTVKQLAGDFARYLDAIANGAKDTLWRQATFGYADDFQSATGHYRGLRGGELQAVQLARVLAQISDAGAERYLLLDEPPANLDIAHQHRVFALARRWSRDGTGVFAILHDLNLAAHYADRMILLESGPDRSAGNAGRGAAA